MGIAAQANTQTCMHTQTQTYTCTENNTMPKISLQVATILWVI